MSTGIVRDLRGEELVLLECFKADDRRSTAAAIQLEYSAGLIERATELRRDRVRRNHDDELYAFRVAAFPSLHPELVSAQLPGEVEARPLTDGSEPEVEPPVAANTVPQIAHKLEAKTNFEVVISVDTTV